MVGGVARSHPIPMRYMGTKRHLAQFVRDEILRLEPNGLVADLFTGMGSVVAALAPRQSVLANDAQAFVGAFARARFTESLRVPTTTVVTSLHTQYARRLAELESEFAPRRAAEEAAQLRGATSLRAFMDSVRHVGSDPMYAERANACRGTRSAARYCLATLYFASGYFSTRQAMQLDALRYAIDGCSLDRDWLLAAWLAAAATVANAPGHAAQFLKPTSEEAAQRIQARWRRCIWGVFIERLDAVAPLGDREWRSANVVRTGAALDALTGECADRIGVVYADPPYTRDQYSRYYHLYETLFAYDFPASGGAGRARPDRFASRFSLASSVEAAFRELRDRVCALGVPLVLSYPRNGLLHSRGVAVEDLLGRRFHVREVLSWRTTHSTMGASKGQRRKPAVEQVFVCTLA